jgi:seipin
LNSGAALTAQQPYDVSVTLTLSQSPTNAELGTFMVGVYLIDRMPSNGIESGPYLTSHDQTSRDLDGIIFASRRPALIPYQDPLVSFASRALSLPYHMLRRGTKPTSLTVPMAESLSFDRSSHFPCAVYLEVEAGQRIQISDATVTLTAKLSGLRYLLHHYRLSAFITLVAAFWSLELIVTSAALFILTAITSTRRSSYALGQTAQESPSSCSDTKAEWVTVKGEAPEHHARTMTTIPEFIPKSHGEDKSGPRSTEGDGRRKTSSGGG